jgi:hypothetical protein
MVIEDLIIKLDKLQQHDKSKFDKFKNPLLSLITSRWYFSESFRLFQDVELNWENCEKTDFVSNLANKMDDFDISTPANSSFEVSFCSWYQPYHFPPRSKWGVHIRYGCWGTLSAGLHRKSPNLNNNPIDSVKAAFFYLYIHELFHYLIENVSSIMELEYEEPLLYINYLRNIYSKVFNTSECLEEALANSYLFERTNLCHIEKQYLEQELLKQHPGYNSFINYTGAKFKDGLRQLFSQIVTEHSDDRSTNKITSTPEYSQFTDFSYIYDIPVWIHQKPLRTYQGNTY